jgi:phage tail sheath protein FI
VRDGDTGQIEIFRNASVVDDHLRRIDKVLQNESKLVRAETPLPGSRPGPHPDPQPGEDVWGDNTPATNSAVVSAGEASDGDALDEDDFTGVGKEGNKEGLFALAKADLFNLLCIPGYVDTGDGFDVDLGLTTSAAIYCEARRAMLLIDPPSAWLDKDAAKSGLAAGIGTTSKNAALFFPRLRQPNPSHDNQKEDFAPCGAVAGVFARTDAQRGVWKAPAGLEATLAGVPELTVSLNDAENGELNPLGINCLRSMPASGRVVWGARTLQGDDRLASEWKYIPVRRTALFLEESLFRGTQWVVFEPNDEPLWAQIRLNIGAFMQSLFRQGAFQGKTPREAYFVKCDSETTTQTDIDHGIVNILVGFAPLKPAEFVVIKIQQLAGQIET